MIDNLFLSVGAMKAGTTWLYDKLRDHPDIYFTPEKEIHYFAHIDGVENQLDHRNRIIKLKSFLQRIANGNPAFIAENLENLKWYAEYATDAQLNNDWYEQLFRLNPGKKFCADFSNLYCRMSGYGWGNVRRIAKNIKVIYTLRDPLERVWSHYKFDMQWNGKGDSIIGAGFEYFKNALNQAYFWGNAEYAKNIELLKQSLSDNELMILYFEDFRKEPLEMLRKIENFLGVSNKEYKVESITGKINSSKDVSMPDEWAEYAKEKLQKESNLLMQKGFWKESWVS